MDVAVAVEMFLVDAVTEAQLVLWLWSMDTDPGQSF